jgi:sugar phosphate isomerase/epimerase
MNRREFLRRTAGITFVTASPAWRQALGAEKAEWPIGCFNRAWTKWTYDEALEGVAQAGYKVTGLLTGQGGEAFTSSAATPEYLASLKKRIAQRGLTVNLSAMRFRAGDPLDANIADVRKQIENAARLELRYLLTFGVDKPEHYENFYRLMADAAAQAEKRGVQIAMKPHGGGSGASEEILRCIEKVAQPNFKIWYDAGNIIYYTGKDPLAELDPIAKYVTGFCAKDCAAPKAEVMSQFGTGKVNFKVVFAKLKAAGFNGPVMVEGVKVGATPAETTANARVNREFLEKTLAAI